MAMGIELEKDVGVSSQVVNNGEANIKRRLAPFFKNNPFSKLKVVDKYVIVEKPWNDESVMFFLPAKRLRGLILTLNNLILPPAFSAIYHVDTNTMEYIYSRLRPDDPCCSRQFKFSLDRKQYKCNFGAASPRLLTLVRNYARAQGSSTGFRNLPNLEEQFTGAEQSPIKLLPISFFVNGFEAYDEDELSWVSKHLNFFMEYYDRHSPFIVLHAPQPEPDSFVHMQYIAGDFPSQVSTRTRDPFMLEFMLAANQVGGRFQFIYCYQIIEYAAFYHVDDGVKRELLRIVQSPDVHSYPEKYVLKILEQVNDMRQDDEAKVNKVVELACSPDIIFKEIESNRKYFSTKQEFEGGFVLEPLIDEKITANNFRAMWQPKTSNTLRFIRNALVHGREKKFGRVISPTPRNDALLRPWCCIARRIAESIILFE